MGAAGIVRSWSTHSLPKAQRLDYWMSALQSALWPVTDFSGFEDFSVELEEASLGALSTCKEHICAHQSRRTRRDVANTAESNLHLFVSLGESWSLGHEGRTVCLRRGDVILVGDGEHETHVPKGFSGIVLKCPIGWIQTWLPEPDKLVGHAITHESKWGAVLSPMMSQLSPQLVADTMLPHQVLTDQLGTVLALIAGEDQLRVSKALLEAIRSCIHERCTETQLAASDVAASLNIPAAEVHRTLMANQLTFATQLSEARWARAESIMTSPAGIALSLEEIATRAGFTSARALARRIHLARRR
jgi:AraC family transcriptional regulator, positive regulator of tynA and feaB